MICPDDKDRHLLDARLTRLGLAVQAAADWGSALIAWHPDVVFFDVDSGTGDLKGLAGAMTIQIADGKHSYELAYTLTTIQ